MTGKGRRADKLKTHRPRCAPRFTRLTGESLEPRLLLAGDITTGLVHYWPFDETTGDTAHDSVGGSDGTLVNWNAAEPKWEPGRVGGALQFSTADDYVIAQPPAMTGSYAVSFWLNVTDRSGTDPRIFVGRAGNEIAINNDSGRGVAFYRTGNRVATADPNPPTYNTWEHYVVNFNVATAQGVIYRSGSPIAIGTFVDSASLTNWVIGHHDDLSNNNDSLNGLLDDLRIYNRVLTDDDIAILGSLGTPEPVHQGPVHHWTFDETTGFTAHDVAGGADGVLLNWGANEPRWEPGKVGGALHISTTDNAIVTPPASTGAQWAIAFWVNLSGGDRFPRVIGPIDGRDLWSFFDIEDHRGLAFISRSVLTVDSQAQPFGVWAHYVINYDTLADVGTIYRNGVQVATGFFGDNSPQQAWVIGHTSDLANNDHTLLGLLDDLRVYDRLLTPSEIQQLATVGAAQANGDAYATSEDATLTVATAEGVLANDSDLDDDSPQAIVDVGPVHGGLSLGADGEFTYSPSAQFNGTDSFTYRLTDGSGNDVTATVSLTIAAINDAPSFGKGPDISLTDEQPSPQIVPNWATAISAGPANEATQQVSFSVSNDANGLFSQQPQIDSDGTLKFTPNPNVEGTATVTVKLKDDGGTANGGVDTSGTQTITVEITKPHRWHNEMPPYAPVNRGGMEVLFEDEAHSITATDVLLIINYLNSGLPTNIPVSAPIGNGTTLPFYDVDADDSVTPTDALLVINLLNAGQGGPAGGEGEGSFAPRPAGTPAGTNGALAELISLMAFDLADQAARRRAR